MTALFYSLQFFLNSVLIVALAPVFYWLAGLPLGYATKKVEWSMLWGVGLVGLTGEMAGIMGISAKMATMAVACGGITGAIFLIQSRAFRSGGISLANELRPNAESYLIALLAVSFVPFAIPGAWGGDWLVALESGQYIAEGERFSLELLGRPALFGAASIPTFIFGDPLASFQIFCAVGSACISQVARAFISSAAHPRAIWLFGGSLFFLQITANAWPKFLAAAFIMTAWISVENNGRWKNLVTGVLLGLALATHQASVLFAPLVLARLWKKTPAFREFLPASAMALAAAALICAPWELYTITAYGLDAKIQANPAVSQRLKDVPTWLNALLVGTSTLVAWGPLVMLKHWITADSPLSPARIRREIYWLATSGFNSLAASLAGILVPWLVALGFKKLSACLFDLWTKIPPLYRVALALGLAGQILLNPFYSADGSLQTGWVPAGAGMLCCLMAWVSCRPRPEQGTVIRNTLLLGLAPWAGFNLLLTTGLMFSARLKEQITVSEGDLQLINNAGVTPLGLGAFPWIQIIVLAGLAILYGKKTPDHYAHCT
jgi:hypothetical protein